MSSSDDEHVTAVQRAVAVFIARRSNAQPSEQTPPDDSSDISEKGMRPELALIIGQQAAMVERLEISREQE